MRGIGTDHARFAGRRLGQEIATDIARRHAHRAQARQHQMREVLADTAFVFQHGEHWRSYRGRLGIELELAEDAPHQRLHRFQQRPFWRKAGRGIGRELALDAGIRRFKQIDAGFEMDRPGAISQRRAAFLPGRRIHERHEHRARTHFNATFSSHQQATMRRFNRKLPDRIAEGVMSRFVESGLGIDSHFVRQTGLPRTIARCQMQQLARDRYRTLVDVACFVDDVVAGGFHVHLRQPASAGRHRRHG